MLQKIKNLASSSTGKDTFVVSIGTIINVIAGGLFFILAPRLLGPANYGIFSTVIATGILITSVSNFGIDTGILKFAKKNSEEFNKTLTTALKSYLILGTVVAIIGLIISPLIASLLGQPQITNLLRIAFLGNILILLSNFYVSGLQASHEFLKASLVNISSNVTRLFLLVLSAYFLIIGLFQLTIIFFLSAVVSVLVGKLLLPFKIGKTNNNEVLKFHKYNLWIALSLIISSIPIDNFIILKVAGPVQTGLYAAPFKILTFAHQLGGNFSRVLASRLSSFDTNEKVIAYSRKSAVIISFFIFGLIIFIIFASQIVKLSFGKEFVGSVIILQTLSLGFIFFLASIIPSSVILYFFGKSDVSFQITVTKYIFLLISLIYFVPKFGALGAAIAFTLAELIAFLLMTLYSFLKLKIFNSD